MTRLEEIEDLLAKAEAQPDLAEYYVGRCQGKIIMADTEDREPLIQAVEAAGHKITHYLLRPQPKQMRLAPKKRRKKAA